MSVRAMLAQRVERLNAVARAERRYDQLATACFEAGHYPNPMDHSVVGCPICEALSRAADSQSRSAG